MPEEAKHLNRFVEMTPDREAAIDALLAAIRKTQNPLPPMLQMAIEQKPEGEVETPHNRERLYAYMFLVSRQWDVQKALVMQQEVSAYRKENNLDQLRMLPSAYSIRGWDEQAIMQLLKKEPRVQPARYDKVVTTIDPVFHSGLHYWDKEGLPVMYMIAGSADERGLMKRLKGIATVGQRPEDVMFEYVQHAMAVAEEICMYQQNLWDKGDLAKDGVDASQGIIRSLTVVVDCGGLTYKALHMPALLLCRNSLSRVFRYYPDCVHRIVVVNCPPVVMFAYNIVKGVLDEGVQRKVKFFNAKESPAALSSIIDTKHLPKELGGECECESGCVRGYGHGKVGKADAVGNDPVPDVLTEDIEIHAGKAHQKVFHLQKDATVFWDFAMENGKDINFSVYFVPASKDISREEKFSVKELEPYLVSKDHPTHDTDSYTAKEDGATVLLWDNKGSWLKSKTVQMRIYVQAEDGIYNQESALVPSTSSATFVPPAEALRADAPLPRVAVHDSAKEKPTTAHGESSRATAVPHEKKRRD